MNFFQSVLHVRQSSFLADEWFAIQQYGFSWNRG